MAVHEFMLPDLGEGLEDAEIVTWRVGEGDHVELNQTLVEVNTAKALVEIPSPWEGVIEALHGAEGDVVKVGLPLVSIRVEEAAPAEAEKPKRRAVLVGYGVADEDASPSTRSRLRGASAGERVGNPSPSGPVLATPPVRRLAKDLGVDLATVAGTGPKGRITREDIVSAGDAQSGAADVERVPVRGVRRLVAEKMTRSVREIPHVTTFLTVDATHLQGLRREIATSDDERVSPLPIAIAALVEVCRSHPTLNASFDAAASEILLFRRCHVGIATDAGGGLLVPVIRDAGAKGIVELARDVSRLAEAARSGTLSPQDLTGSTITVTNVGTFGAEFGTPIINHPEAAILALGVVEPRALVVEGRVQARPAMTLSLSFDHRLLDGAEAGRALRALADLLENPYRLGALPR